ncbi:endonuclease/exonuclease/phosphatase family protein [Saccharopolyspora hordei]|uniref:Endonuclease/exonuclease/phosphatase (EEP) superfamily protein YafD n=1 Tax=Saccharopolyspora hordei TaxID=1838 RepID=A0A853ADB1_9PSEU|nr:endonuclease/exonuclease/phosphatase family protein [Saccharopolyspora hordei]NYI82115.1 endonuclease/exonuclease/phosphatase (EEP) superfamily protein YafD [Saccharopolyspora hordei]
MVRRSTVLWLVAALSAALATALPVAHAQAPAARSFDVLQLTLCGDGDEACAGPSRSVDAAIETIHQRRPDVVTLNEVCASDITRMTSETGYGWEFAPAGDATTGAPATCRDGRGDLGVAILSHPDVGAPGEPVEQPFAAQDGSGVQRVLLCVPYSQLSACTAHLSEEGGQVAADQCRELTATATALGAQAVLAGDLSLVAGGDPDVQNCVPEGWYRADDGSVQHVFAMEAFRFEGAEVLPIDGSAHPGLLVQTLR